MSLPDDDWIRRNVPDWLTPMARELLVVHLASDSSLNRVAFELGVRFAREPLAIAADLDELEHPIVDDGFDTEPPPAE